MVPEPGKTAGKCSLKRRIFHATVTQHFQAMCIESPAAILEHHVFYEHFMEWQLSMPEEVFVC